MPWTTSEPYGGFSACNSPKCSDTLSIFKKSFLTTSVKVIFNFFLDKIYEKTKFFVASRSAGSIERFIINCFPTFIGITSGWIISIWFVRIKLWWKIKHILVYKRSTWSSRICCNFLKTNFSFKTFFYFRKGCF